MEITVLENKLQMKITGQHTSTKASESPSEAVFFQTQIAAALLSWVIGCAKAGWLQGYGKQSF